MGQHSPCHSLITVISALLVQPDPHTQEKAQAV
jgi:hypothetical protein